MHTVNSSSCRLFRAQSTDPGKPKIYPIQSKSRLALDLVCVALLVFLPPLIFEEYTYYLYSIRSSQFFNFSGERVWFDIIWFALSGLISVLIIGRKRWIAVIPSLVSAAFFTIFVYAQPFCFQSECYISSTDGLGPLRDFLLFASLGFVTSNAALSNNLFDSLGKNTKLAIPYTLLVTGLFGYALSFFPLLHIFAGVSAPYPLNYLQWFIAVGPPAFLGSLWAAERGPKFGSWFKFCSGMSGVSLGLILAIDVPCAVCSGYNMTIGSLLLVGSLFSLYGHWAWMET